MNTFGMDDNEGGRVDPLVDDSAIGGIGSKGAVSRRLILRSGAGLGLLALAGCAGKSTVYPDPVMPGSSRSAGGTLPPSRGPIALPPLGSGQGGGPRGPGPGVPSGVMSRASWTRAPVARPREINPFGRVTRITVHHEGSLPFSSLSQDAVRTRLEQVRQAHVRRGWADIGYHFVIDPAGRVWEGRSLSWQGAHVKDQNEGNLGIMCLGNYEVQQPTSAMLATLDRFVSQQMRQYRVGIGQVRTHREFAPTECPGRSLQRYMLATRARGGNLAVALSAAGADDLMIA